MAGFSRTPGPRRRGSPSSSSVRSPLVLREQVDPLYTPTRKETLEYAAFIGFDVSAESPDLEHLHIARAALKAPMPSEWSPCRDPETGDVYYFNFVSGESAWEHPNDAIFRAKFLKAASTQRSKPKPKLRVRLSSRATRTKKRGSVHTNAGAAAAKHRSAATSPSCSRFEEASAFAGAALGRLRVATAAAVTAAAASSASSGCVTTPTPTGGGSVKARSPPDTSRRLRSELAACRAKLQRVEQRSAAGDARIAMQSAVLAKVSFAYFSIIRMTEYFTIFNAINID